MLNYPDVMKRCQAEIDDVLGQHREPSMKDKASLPYLECTLLEIQRMSSIVPFGVISPTLFLFESCFCLCTLQRVSPKITWRLTTNSYLSFPSLKVKRIEFLN